MSESKVKQLTPYEDFRHTLNKGIDQIKAALPAHISVDKFIRVCLTAVQSNPDILNSDKRVLFSELLKCASDGITPDGREAAITVYKTKNGPQAKYLLMTQGLLKRIRNSGELAAINAQVVYSEDKFDYFIDEHGTHILHKPELIKPRGDVILTYAIASTKDGAVFVEVITEEQMTAVRAISKAKEFGPWQSFPDEMRRKTAIRRLSKRLPMDSDSERLVQNDDDLYDLKQTEQPKLENKSASRLDNLLESLDAPAVQLEDDVRTEVKDIPMPEEALRGK